jgi:cobalt-precorrin 5A hydrolase
MAPDDAHYAMDGDQAMIQRIKYARLSIGFGCSSGADSHEIVRLIKASIDPVPSNTTLATIDRLKSIGEVVSAILGIKLAVFPSGTLACVEGITINSSLVSARAGTPSVAEAAALASLGPDAHLLVAQTKGRFCTCAVAALPIEVKS